MADFWKRSGLFDENRSGFAFREVFTPTREGPLPPRPKAHRSGVGGGPQTPVTPVTSVWSASDASANAMTLSNGGLTVTSHVVSGWQTIRSTISKTSGKVYVEFLAGDTSPTMRGLASAGIDIGSYLGNSNYSGGGYANVNFVSAGFTSNYTFAQVVAANDVWGLAVDFASGGIWISQNNVWLGGSNPATGSLPIISFVPATVGPLFAALSFNAASNGVWTLQGSDASLKYRPPAGFQAWDGGPVTPVTSVWSASDAAGGATLSNGNLTATPTAGSGWRTLRGTINKSSGKLYIEFGTSAAVTSYIMLGLANAGFGANENLGAAVYSFGFQPPSTFNTSAGFTQANSGTIASVAANDVLALAIDFAAQQIWIARNNTWIVGNPAAGTTPLASFVAATVGALFPALSFYDPGSGVWTLQPTAASQKYAPPAGFSAWHGGVAPPPTSVWSASDAAAVGFTLSNGGLTMTGNGLGTWDSIRGTISKTSGMLYVEFKNTVATTSQYITFGVGNAACDVTKVLGLSDYSFGATLTGGNYLQMGAGGASNYFTSVIMPANGDVWAIAVDLGTGKFWLAQNNVWFGSGNPGTGANPMMVYTPAIVGALFPAMSLYSIGTGTWTLQATAASQKYAPPAGFSPWG